MKVNTFVVNPILPDYVCALVDTRFGAVTIWCGFLRDMPEKEFQQADQAHVNQWTYDRIAARAEATGKGQPYDGNH